jgi:recombination protein RecA
MTGSLAKIMSQAMVEISAAADIGNTCVIFVNQLRDKVGVLYGDSSTTSGGNALSYYASLRLFVTRKKNITDETGLIGNFSGVQVKKSKISIPYISTGEKSGIPDMRVYYNGQDPNEKSDILVAAVDKGLVEQNGPMYTFDGVKAKGKEALIEALSEAQWLALCEQLAKAAPVEEGEEDE